MTLTDVDISKPSAAHVDAASVKRTAHPGAPLLPVIAALLLVAAAAANVFSLQTTSWLKTTTYRALFNSDGKIEPGVNGSVTTRVSASEICFFVTNVTPPAKAQDYCVDYDAKHRTDSGVDVSTCEYVRSKEILGSVGMSWDSHEAEFIRGVCDGLGNATIVLQIGAIVAAGLALIAVCLSCLCRRRAGKALRIACVLAALLSGALALTTYILWLTKLSSGDMHHGKSAVLTAGSVFLLGGAALAASSGLEIFADPTPAASEATGSGTKEAPEADSQSLANAA